MIIRFCNRSPAEDRHLELACESLEPREMLAGDVSVHVSAAGNVRIDGDNADNQIRVASDALGDVWVYGEDGTTIDGFGAFQINGDGTGTIEGNLTIRLKGGADRAVVRNVNVEGNVLGITGNSNDAFMMSRVIVEGNATINTAQGSDLVQVVHTMLHGKLTINTAAGPDRVLIGLASDIDGRTLIKTGSGLDQVFINNEFDGSLTINTGSSHDLVALHSMDIIAPFKVILGSGDDNLFVHSLANYSQITVNGGAGHDVVYSEPGVNVVGETNGIDQFTHFAGTDLTVHGYGESIVEYYLNAWDGLFFDYL